jgi:hypothetical protein
MFFLPSIATAPNRREESESRQGQAAPQELAAALPTTMILSTLAVNADSLLDFAILIR